MGDVRRDLDPADMRVEERPPPVAGAPEPQEVVMEEEDEAERREFENLVEWADQLKKEREQDSSVWNIHPHFLFFLKDE